VGLIAKQPDLGTAILVAAAGFYVLFCRPHLAPDPAGGGGRDRRHRGHRGDGRHHLPAGRRLAGPAGIPETPGVHLLDPTSDPLGKGFHIIQSTIAIGSGGVLGKGWGNGTQTHLDFLPERHTDFIFAVLTEEFGLAGALFLVYSISC
jgi:rod shape determining protein RodA